MANKGNYKQTNLLLNSVDVSKRRSKFLQQERSDKTRR